MKNVTLIIAALSLFACKDGLDRVQAATDAKTYTCRYLELQDSSNPRIARAQELCKTSAEVQLILAAAAGEESCREAYPAN